MKVYCALVRRAQCRQLEGYKEKHHIFPVSIFGKNDMVVELTAREHYIAHCLLERICIRRYGISHIRTQKMLCAHMNMKGKKNRYYNSYLYSIAKVRRSESMRGELHWNWKGGYKYKKKDVYDTNERYKRYTYMLIDPTGEKIETNSLRKTCEENNLDHRNMSLVAKGKRNHHKGWKCEVINSL